MTTATPNVSKPTGAPFGRVSAANNTGEKVTLQRVRINRQGYDDGGAYWGVGQRLYAWTAGDGTWSYVRATDRDGAKEHIRRYWPEARFYR